METPVPLLTPAPGLPNPPQPPSVSFIWSRFSWHVCLHAGHPRQASFRSASSQPLKRAETSRWLPGSRPKFLFSPHTHQAGQWLVHLGSWAWPACSGKQPLTLVGTLSLRQSLWPLCPSSHHSQRDGSAINQIMPLPCFRSSTGIPKIISLVACPFGCISSLSPQFYSLHSYRIPVSLTPTSS